MTRISRLFSLLTAYFTLGVATSTIQANGAMVDYSTLIAYLNNPTHASITTAQIIGNTGPGANEVLFNTSSAIMPVNYTAIGANFATAVISNIARPMVLKDARVCFSNASTSGNITLEKLTGNTAPGSGTTLLTGTMNLAGPNNNVVVGTLNATTASITFAAGDRLGIVVAGTLASQLGLDITATLAPV